MQEFIINFMDKFGYLGIALLIAIENIFPPIPSEIILTFGGFMTTSTSMNVYLVILFATIGSVVGAIVLYLIGRILNVQRLEKLFAGKFGKVMRLKPEDVTKANDWFSKHGKKTVFLCRFIPIVRSLISIPAGVNKMKITIFLPLTLLGTVIWNTVLVFLGRLAGSMWERIAGYFDIYSTIALIVFGLALVIIAAIFIKKRLLKKPDKTDGTTTSTSPENKKDISSDTNPAESKSSTETNPTNKSATNKPETEKETKTKN